MSTSNLAENTRQRPAVPRRPAAVAPIRVAVLDLYDNLPNEGMRCIKELLTESDGKYWAQPVTYEIFETRYKAEICTLDFDIYISTGGPGSPFDGEGKLWERRYFQWWEAIWRHNQREAQAHARKYVFAICHSFQMMCRFFKLAAVTKRGSKSFGIMPIHKTPAGERERLYASLGNPFYAADFRDWQVVEPNTTVLQALGAEVLSLEKIRPHVPLERSITAIRVSPEIIGVQFHPEADPRSMLVHAVKPERKQDIIARHGEKKYQELIRRLQDPECLAATRRAIIPGFLQDAIARLRPEYAGQTVN
ncbi:MAG: GMP synthase [candidate division KSB1 bacterium]|nr:GMP synthase [candidate division KSB1 bacterium]MDZ7272492.1 GMP synthase [candidate division KSB1 bacterium]MDZ7284484.1 GMP synthase [candidate division KSB1 bacterium]MDZ7297120.1 GMP synthase [candidate division KSB1 bacterium]MDZ7306568.1 GMP synthase [candidate division KSB1 bacterium]